MSGDEQRAQDVDSEPVRLLRMAFRLRILGEQMWPPVEGRRETWELFTIETDRYLRSLSEARHGE